MEKRVNYLPLGSVVVVNGGINKFVIVARGLQIDVEGSKYFFDYGACQYPIGMTSDQLIYFQHSNIKKVVFNGFSDEENELMIENINDSIEKNNISRIDVELLRK